MIQHRHIAQTTRIHAADILFNKRKSATQHIQEFPNVRPSVNERHFTSEAVESTIRKVKSLIPDRKLSWLFENCFAYTLDNLVYMDQKSPVPDTYIVTGDKVARQLSNSAALVMPYLPLIKEDRKLQQLIAGVINWQVRHIHIAYHAKLFPGKESKTDLQKDTEPGRKSGRQAYTVQIDLMSQFIRLCYQYWKYSNDSTPFNSEWKDSIATIIRLLKERQQRINNDRLVSQYTAQNAENMLSIKDDNFGSQGLIQDAFDPNINDRECPFSVPSNFFAAHVLRQAAIMIFRIHNDKSLALECLILAAEISNAIDRYAIVTHPIYGKVYAFEVDGPGNHMLMNEAIIPGLLSLPYLGCIPATDPIYQNTRRMILSYDNLLFIKGKVTEGIGKAREPMDRISTISIITRALTSNKRSEIKQSITTLRNISENTAFVQESFNKDDPSYITKGLCVWANTLFAELILDVCARMPELFVF